MEFCPKCESLLIPKKEKMNVFSVCMSCGHKQKGADAKIVEKPKSFERVVAVESQTSTMPVADADCPKCGHKRAYFRSEQTRAADEPETLFFTCVKCAKTWREYE